jgi:hypothetical protein
MFHITHISTTCDILLLLFEVLIQEQHLRFRGAWSQWCLFIIGSFPDCLESSEREITVGRFCAIFSWFSRRVRYGSENITFMRTFYNTRRVVPRI